MKHIEYLVEEIMQLLAPIKEKQWENLAHCTNLKGKEHAGFTCSLSSHEFSIGAHSVGWNLILEKVSKFDSYKSLLLQSFGIFDEYMLCLGV